MPTGDYWMNENKFLFSLIMENAELSADSGENSSPTYHEYDNYNNHINDDDDCNNFTPSYNDSDTEKHNSSEDVNNSRNYHITKKMRYNEENNQETTEVEDTRNDTSTGTKLPSTIGERMMQRMGYSEGTGLGKYGQGRLNPVEAFQQKGRRGLGHDNTKLSEAKLKWDPSAEVIEVQEDMAWLYNTYDNDYLPPLTEEELKNWMIMGSRKETIDDEATFCNPHILQQVIDSKSVFDNLDKNEMRRARTRSNPYETIRGAFFLNRAAVKMANMDKACDFMFSRPSKDLFTSDTEPLYFADVCAGPGGFSEYILWRAKWEAKGFGFTLKDSNDFKLEDFYAGSPETFHTFYGPKKDGNVYDPDNQAAFRQMILEQTRTGVHFMMSDGGFSVEGQENIQEILSKQLYLCQCLMALKIVRTGGHFVTKLFDLFTPFSAGLVYLMLRCFQRVSIFKPNTSRPANSERYLICQGKLPNTDDVMNYLDRVNLELLKCNNKNIDVIELVPIQIMLDNDNFFNYLKESNDSLGSKQVVGLLKIAAYCEDSTLFEHRQAQIRKECLEYWEVPDQARTRPRDGKPEDRLKLLLANNSAHSSSIQSLCKLKPQDITHDVGNLEKQILNPAPCNWYCAPCEAKNNTSINSTSYGNDEYGPIFFFSMGRTKVYKCTKQGTWSRIDNIQLPPDTLIYGEIVTEYRGEYRKQLKTTALHIIDAWFLGGKDISRMFLPERHEQINKFCEALWSPETKPLMRIRPKPIHFLSSNLTEKLQLIVRYLKNGSIVNAHYPGEPSYSYEARDNNEEKLFFVPNSLLFLRSTAHPWTLFLSRSSGVHYFFSTRDKETVYNDRRPETAVANFTKTFETRVVWNWLHDQTMNLENLCQKIKEKCPYVSMNDRLPY